MSTREARGAAVNEAEETTIGTYLRQNPDFFVRNEPLLAHLRLPHARGSAAVSLVERQVEVLREKNQALEGRLAELIAVARSNDQLADKIHRYTRRLMGAGSRRDVVEQVEKSLREDFAAFHSTLLLFGTAGAGLEPGRFVQLVERGDSSLAGFETLLTSGKPRCGQVRDSQREFLFGNESAGVASLALVPLGSDAAMGLLALGSPERDRFHPGMSTDFLTRMGELLADALSRR
jgi:uncharacterized protein YigA (DUF484 family)